jgi:DNA polymerase III, alpha subunit
MSKVKYFEKDTIDMEDLNRTIAQMIDELAFDLRKERKLTGCLTLKIRYSNFETVTRQQKISFTCSEKVLLEQAKSLFTKLYSRRMLIRLIGIKFSELVTGAYQVDLFNDVAEDLSLMQAMDQIRLRFGKDMIKKGILLPGKKIIMLLNVHSHYSLRYGTLSPERLIDSLIANGYESAVLTDINNSSAVLDFIHKAQGKGLNALAGVEFRNADELLYIGIAKNPAGFRELNELLTAAHRDNRPYPVAPPPMNDVLIVYPYGKKAVRELQDNEYIGVKASQVNKILLDPAAAKARYVILHPVTFHPDEYKLHIQLRAIDHNLLISQLEPQQMAGGDEILVPLHDLLERYERVPELIRNTRQLFTQCSFCFDFKAVKNNRLLPGALCR